MPFTGSHVAAILPFIRWRLPASALVVGSVVPDLPYYLPMPVHGSDTHTLVGVAGPDLLLGLVVVLAWRSFVGPAVAALAPPAVGRRLNAARSPVAVANAGGVLGYVRSVPAIVVALLLGSLTHVGWDAFTHVDGWFTERFGVLRADLGPLPPYRWAQYLSGVVGGLIIAAWTAR